MCTSGDYVIISYGVDEARSMTLEEFHQFQSDLMNTVRHKLGPDVTVWTGPPTQRCRVYWGSHGCCLIRSHSGDCLCECFDDLCAENDCPNGTVECSCNVGAAPYCGIDTTFYGEDVEARGLPTTLVRGEDA